MAKFAVVNSSWLAHGHRWDADFWIKLTEMLQKRGITWDQAKTVEEAIKELHDRGQFPTGTKWYPGKKMAHVECPNCMSWNVDSVEITKVITVEARKTTQFEATYVCRRCNHSWEEKRA